MGSTVHDVEIPWKDCHTPDQANQTGQPEGPPTDALWQREIWNNTPHGSYWGRFLDHHEKKDSAEASMHRNFYVTRMKYTVMLETLSPPPGAHSSGPTEPNDRPNEKQTTSHPAMEPPRPIQPHPLPLHFEIHRAITILLPTDGRTILVGLAIHQKWLNGF